MDPVEVKLKYPFPEVNVVVDCGGGRVNGPAVNIDIVNGAVDARKSDVRIKGEYHLHPFQSPAPDGNAEAVARLLVKTMTDLHHAEVNLQALMNLVVVPESPAKGTAPPAPGDDELAVLMTEVERVFLAGAEALTDRKDAQAAETLRRLALYGGFCRATAVKLYPTPDPPAPRAAPPAGDDPVREQAFKELVGLVFAKLYELTPRAWVHLSYSTTQNDLVANAAQIVAQLKDSPTLAAVAKTLSLGEK